MGAHDLSEEEQEKIKQEWHERRIRLLKFGIPALVSQPIEVGRRKSRRRGGFREVDDE